VSLVTEKECSSYELPCKNVAFCSRREEITDLLATIRFFSGEDSGNGAIQFLVYG